VAAQPRQVDRQPLADLGLGAAEAALELDVALLAGGRGQRRRLAARRPAGGLRTRPGRQRRQRRPQGPPQLLGLAAVAVQLLVEPGVERVVVDQRVVDLVGQRPLEV
jgi:hypothetical protein